MVVCSHHRALAGANLCSRICRRALGSIRSDFADNWHEIRIVKRLGWIWRSENMGERVQRLDHPLAGFLGIISSARKNNDHDVS